MKKEYSGWPGDCSADQLKVLDEFRTAVRNMGCQSPPYDDPYLLRFLRARKFDLTKALQMWTNFIKWRTENNVDDIGNFQMTEIKEVRPLYPHNYFRTDRQGRPVYIERVGQLKLTQLYKITSQERLLKYYCQSYEKLLHKIFPACSRATGVPIAQTVTILDLKGGSMGMVSKQVYDFVKLASGIAQDYYPEILGQMFIVNAPMLFTGVWAVMKPWIDEKTRNKIKILGGSYQKELFAVVDPDNLPDFLGGKVPVSEYGQNFENEQGPWVDEALNEKLNGKVLTQGEEETKDDFSDLKSALSGLNLPGSKPQPGKPGAVTDSTKPADNTKPPADTPLNTQIDGDDDNPH